MNLPILLQLVTRPGLKPGSANLKPAKPVDKKTGWCDALKDEPNISILEESTAKNPPRMRCTLGESTIWKDVVVGQSLSCPYSAFGISIINKINRGLVVVGFKCIQWICS